MATQFQTGSRERQRGAATLLIAVFILLMLTVMVVFVANTAFLEQRMSANELRAITANAGAQAGMELALQQLEDPNTLPTALFAENHDGTAGQETFLTYRTRYFRPDIETLPECPTDPDDAPFDTPVDAPANTRQLLIYSCGYSDDLSSRSVALIEVRAGPSLGSPPNAPLVSRGSVNTFGRARAFNLFDNLTLWSGASLDVTGNPGNTFVRNPEFNPADGREPNLENTPASCDWGKANDPDDEYICLTDKDTTGPDVIQGDPGLSSLTNDEFFEVFMGSPRQEYEESVATVRTQSTAELAGMGGQVIWVDGEGGDIDLSGTIGSRDNPVVLVLDGNLDVSGNVTVYGVVYVTGDVKSATGNVTFYGTTIIEGQFTKAAGTPFFIFDPTSLEIASGLGRRVGLYGTWRDWIDE